MRSLGSTSAPWTLCAYLRPWQAQAQKVEKPDSAIGRMYEVDTPLGKQWRWSVYGLVLDGYPPAGMADSWEAAMNAQGGLGGGREEVGDPRPHGAVPAMGRAWGLAGNDTRNVKTIGGVSLFQI